MLLEKEEKEMNETEFNEGVLKTYNRLPVFFEKGKGCYLYDKNKKPWLDFISGIGVNNLGHSHPKLIKALKKQGEKLWHTSNLYYITPQGELAKKISDLSFKGKTFFCNSGAEANESAIKLCRKWGNSLSPQKNILLSLKQSFHGRTLASITLTGQPIYQKGFEPLPAAMQYVEPNNMKDLEEKLTPQVAGLFLEVVQGEGGVVPLSKEFLQKARELCTKNQTLLVFDEVQTGIGRTGKFFAYQHTNIKPDVLTLAKALGNGVPIGALHVKDEFAVLVPGDHASTFGGNFLASFVALAVLKEIEKPLFLKQVVQIGNFLKEGLLDLKKQFPQFISDIRGLGMMWGIVSSKAPEIFQKLFEKRILCTNIKNQVIRILPPLIAQKKEINLFLSSLKEVLTSLEK